MYETELVHSTHHNLQLIISDITLTLTLKIYTTIVSWTSEMIIEISF